MRLFDPDIQLTMLIHAKTVNSGANYALGEMTRFQNDHRTRRMAGG